MIIYKNILLKKLHIKQTLKSIATLKPQVYKGNLENVSKQYDIALFLIVYKAEVYIPQTFKNSI